MKNIFLAGFAACFFFFSAVFSGAGDVVFGGSSAINYSILVSDEKFKESVPELTVYLSPTLDIENEQYEFSFLGSVSYMNIDRAPDLYINTFRLKLNPFPFMSLSIGRMPYLPGSSEFISPVNYFSRVDYEKLLKGSTGDYLINNDIIQAGFYYSDFYFLLTLAPFAGRFILPDIDSAWFPRKGIPNSITVTFPVDQVMHLENLSYDEPDLLNTEIKNMALSTELGGTLQAFDFSFIYYHGTDNVPLLSGRFNFPQGLFEDYDVFLAEKYRLIDALGVMLAADVYSFRFWTDTSYTFKKTFLTKRLSSKNFATELDTSPYFEYSLGSSYELYPWGSHVFLFFEYRNALILKNDDYVDYLLSRLIVFSANLRLFDDRATSLFTVLHSTQDGSNGFAVKLAYNPSDVVQVSLLVPLFSGNEDTDFGQYKENHLISCSLTYSF